MKSTNLTITSVLVFIAFVVATLTIYVPIMLAVFASYLYEFFRALGIDEPTTITCITYAAMYFLSFFLLFYSSINRRVSYVLFCLIHYALAGPGFLVAFMNNDGQAALLIFPYCLVSAFLVFPIAWLWEAREMLSNKTSDKLPVDINHDSI